MADKKGTQMADKALELDPKDIKRHLDMLDQRLDNIDSIVSAVAERIMNRPMVINITCPHCGSDIEISVIGNTKPKS